MKRLTAALLAAALLLSLAAGCSRRQDDAPPTEPEDTAQEASAPSDPLDEGLPPEEAAQWNREIDSESIHLLQFDIPEDAPIATIQTSMGDIRVALFPGEAPKAVENFTALARAGYYDGQLFYRVLNYYTLEGGDPTGSGLGGESSFRDEEGAALPFENEYSLNLWHFRGALAMDNDGEERHTNGSRFYIVQAPFIVYDYEDGQDVLELLEEAGVPDPVIERYDRVGGIPGFDWRRTVFGMVADTESFQVLDTIARTEVYANGEPVEDVVIQTVTVD